MYGHRRMDCIRMWHRNHQHHWCVLPVMYLPPVHCYQYVLSLVLANLLYPAPNQHVLPYAPFPCVLSPIDAYYFKAKGVTLGLLQS